MSLYKSVYVGVFCVAYNKLHVRVIWNWLYSISSISIIGVKLWK